MTLKSETNGNTVIPPPSPLNLLIALFHRLICYFFLTLVTLIGIFNFFHAIFLWPLKLVSPKWYRKMCSWWLSIATPGFLCVPFSWRGTKLYSNSLNRLKKYKNKDLLILANHQGRIDWMIGLFISWTYGQRVSFVTEAFIMFLPFIGWQRYLVEDMFVFRSFKRDRDRLIKNIEDFQKSGVTRWVFLCPEGHIADFNATDKKYIEDCEEFCKSHGLEPFEMILTPRYKGMQCFNRIMTKGDPEITAKDISVTMSYVQNGERLVKPLRSNDRITPDLWNIVQGGLECHCHIHSLELSNDPGKLKMQILTDYSLKDKLLKEFYITGRYPDAYPGKSIEDSPDSWKPEPDEDLPMNLLSNKIEGVNHSDVEKNFNQPRKDYFQKVPVKHFAMNVSFFSQMYLWWFLVHYLNISYLVKPTIALLYLLLSASHILGELMANGQSRESLPFEGVFKAIMFRLQGIEGSDSNKQKTEA